MSLPRELLDQLLTGYLDDALSSDERARVERLLQTDPEIVDELSELRLIRRSLQAVSQADSVIKLEKGFSDRVLGAAVARARAEGLGDDHPLVRLAEQPSTTRQATTPHAAPWRVASLLVGLAASIVIAVIAFRPPADEGPLLAEVQPIPEVVEADPSAAPDIVPEAPEAVEPEMIASTAVKPEMIASTDPGPGLVSPSPLEKDPIVDPEPDTPRIEAIATSQQDALKDLAAMAAALKDRKSFVMVLDVQLTKAGRQSGAVDEAMKSASLAPASRKKVTDELAAFAKGAIQPSPDGEKVSVLYLQSTVKKLDQFYSKLFHDIKGIKSVRMLMTVNAPIQNAVKAVAVDPRLVQKNEATLELFGDNGVVDVFAQQLGQLPFGPMPVNRQNGNVIPKTKGPDVPSQMLVLVR